MKILYYDCFSGISGDMNLGALIDLGVDRNYLLGELHKLDAGGFEFKALRDQRRGVSGTRVEIVVDSGAALPAEHATEARTLQDITELIEFSGLSDSVKEISLNIFAKIAQAEAKVHGRAPGDVHFHEVGAIDSIVDIVGAAVCLDWLKPDRIMSTPVELGGGFVRCSHGVFPVPAPATAEILKGIPVRTGGVCHEATTPTGAAILATVVDEFTQAASFSVMGIGYGIGQRDTERPNVLRVFLAEGTQAIQTADVEKETAFLIECNLDDMNPELYGDMIDNLFQRGALDVFLTPIIMKKSRPAIKVGVLCNQEQLAAVEEALWLTTSTFGLRTQRVEKAALRRDFSLLSTKYGEVQIKNGYYRGKKIKSKPEYEDLRKLAAAAGISVREIYDSIGRIE